MGAQRECGCARQLAALESFPVPSDHQGYRLVCRIPSANLSDSVTERLPTLLGSGACRFVVQALGIQSYAPVCRRRCSGGGAYATADIVTALARP